MSTTSPVTTDMEWKKTLPGSWECNIDAARFLNAFVRRLEGQPEVCEAEALRLLEALKYGCNN
ncbi:hypothetical protein A2U01_0108269, partial [Trifolium medium]|nr:hypothetical protein [Trifolium medium]